MGLKDCVFFVWQVWKWRVWEWQVYLLRIPSKKDILKVHCSWQRRCSWNPSEGWSDLSQIRSFRSTFWWSWSDLRSFFKYNLFLKDSCFCYPFSSYNFDKFDVSPDYLKSNSSIGKKATFDRYISWNHLGILISHILYLIIWYEKSWCIDWLYLWMHFFPNCDRQITYSILYYHSGIIRH